MARHGGLSLCQGLLMLLLHQLLLIHCRLCHRGLATQLRRGGAEWRRAVGP